MKTKIKDYNFTLTFYSFIVKQYLPNVCNTNIIRVFSAKIVLLIYELC